MMEDVKKIVEMKLQVVTTQNKKRKNLFSNKIVQ
jgi:hypothetical protein